MTISSTDKEKIKRVVPKGSNKVLEATVARLYIAYPDSQQWSYTGLSGAIVLVDDLVGHTFWLKIVDINGNRGVLWDQELYTDFTYNQDRSFFHSFELEECYAGLLFDDTSDASHFFKKVTSKEKYGSKKTIQNKNTISLKKQDQDFSKAPGPRGEHYHNNTSDKQRIRRTTHVTYYDGQPPVEWRSLYAELNAAGITEDMIADNKDFIKEYINQQGGPLVGLEPPIPRKFQYSTNSTERDIAITQSLPSREIKKKAPPPPPPTTSRYNRTRDAIESAQTNGRDGDTSDSDSDIGEDDSNIIQSTSSGPKIVHNLPPPFTNLTPVQGSSEQPSAQVPRLSVTQRPNAPAPPPRFQTISSQQHPSPPPPPPRVSMAPPPPPRAIPSNLSSNNRTAPPAPPPRRGPVPPPPPSRNTAAPPAPPSRISQTDRGPSIQSGAPNFLPSSESHELETTMASHPPSFSQTGIIPPPPPLPVFGSDLPSNSAPPAPPAPPPFTHVDTAPPPPPLPILNNVIPDLTSTSAPVVGGGRDDLLASIRNAGGVGSLKKVDKSQLDRPSVILSEGKGKNTSSNSSNGGLNNGNTTGGSLADAIQAALNSRKSKVSRSDDESDGEDW